MTTVYAVSHGTYSDYNVDALFSSREMAQAFMDAQMAPFVACDQDDYNDFNDIKEYELDTPLCPIAGCFEVVINWLGGVVHKHYDAYARSDSPPVRVAKARDRWYHEYWGPSPAGDAFCGSGPTLEHARRSAEELRRATVVLTEMANS